MRACPACAGENDDNAIFCATCGDIIEWESSGGPIVADRPGSSRFQAPQPAPTSATPRPARPPPTALRPAGCARSAAAPTCHCHRPRRPCPRRRGADGAAPGRRHRVAAQPVEPTGAEVAVAARRGSGPAECRPPSNRRPIRRPSTASGSAASSRAAASCRPPSPERAGVAPSTPAGPGRRAGRRSTRPSRRRGRWPRRSRSPSAPAAPTWPPACGPTASRSAAPASPSPSSASSRRASRASSTPSSTPSSARRTRSIATVVPIAVSHGDELAVTVELQGAPGASRSTWPRSPCSGSEDGQRGQPPRRHAHRDRRAPPAARVRPRVRRHAGRRRARVGGRGVEPRDARAGRRRAVRHRLQPGADRARRSTTSPPPAQRCPHIVLRDDQARPVPRTPACSPSTTDATSPRPASTTSRSSPCRRCSTCSRWPRATPASSRSPGFGALFDAIHTTIWEPARRRAWPTPASSSPTSPTTWPSRSRPPSGATGSPQAAEQTIARLDRDPRPRPPVPLRAARAGSSGSPRGCRTPRSTSTTTCAPACATLARLAEGRVDADDPADDLVFEAWLHKAAIEAVDRPLRADRRAHERARRRDRRSTSPRSTGRRRSRSRRRRRPTCSPTCTSTGSSACQGRRRPPARHDRPGLQQRAGPRSPRSSASSAPCRGSRCWRCRSPA